MANNEDAIDLMREVDRLRTRVSELETQKKALDSSWEDIHDITLTERDDARDKLVETLKALDNLYIAGERVAFTHRWKDNTGWNSKLSPDEMAFVSALRDTSYLLVGVPKPTTPFREEK